MKKIPTKNYVILAVLILVTVLLTLFLASLYKNSEAISSNFYNYSNKITASEFKEYMLENDDAIIYLADKVVLTHESFENSLQEKIDSYGLKNKLVYIDKKEITDKFIKEFNDEYNTVIDKKQLPIIIFIVDNKIVNITYINSDTKVDSLIDFEVML